MGAERRVGAGRSAAEGRAAFPAQAVAFLRAARAYWFGVYPHVARELRFWRGRAGAIEDPVLRAHALAALAKRGNMEGAAAFATFVPRRMRARVVRATVAFQAAYNHLDVLSEQACADPERAGRMHRALIDSLAPIAGELLGAGTELRGGRYRAGERDVAGDGGDSRGGRVGRYVPDERDTGGDGGYLAALVETCREAVAGLPSWAVARPWAVRAAERVIAFQTHQDQGPAGDLRWWEATAANGSSLGVHAAIALAAEPNVTRERARALHDAYFPWISALHSLLDHLVDAAEDERDGQRNLIACYATRAEAAERMVLLADRALAAARTYSAHDATSAPGRARVYRKPTRARTYRHELVVAAMACFYLADPGAQTPEAAPVAEAVLERFGPLARGPLAVFRARGWLAGVRRPLPDSRHESAVADRSVFGDDRQAQRLGGRDDEAVPRVGEHVAGNRGRSVGDVLVDRVQAELGGSGDLLAESRQVGIGHSLGCLRDVPEVDQAGDGDDYAIRFFGLEQGICRNF